MKAYRNIFIILFISLFFAACSSKNSGSNIQSASLEKTLLKNSSNNNKLYSFYKEWRGVKYRYGGESKRGVDCSSLIQKAYKQSYNIALPRTTKQQAKVGKQIKKSQLKTGDLIFFKTGKKSRHVGIYMKNGKFFHASTKKGVTISRLDNIYFSRHYWKSVRVLY